MFAIAAVAWIDTYPSAQVLNVETVASLDTPHQCARRSSQPVVFAERNMPHVSTPVQLPTVGVVGIAPMAQCTVSIVQTTSIPLFTHNAQQGRKSGNKN